MVRSLCCQRHIATHIVAVRTPCIKLEDTQGRSIMGKEIDTYFCGSYAYIIVFTLKHLNSLQSLKHSKTFNKIGIAVFYSPKP